MTSSNRYEKGDYNLGMRRGLILTATLVAGVVMAPSAQVRTGALPPASPRNASYSIDAELDASRRTLTGREVITWRNVTTAAPDDCLLYTSDAADE